jgi:uncharacterized protein YciI
VDFHIQLIDNADYPERRDQSREAHWQYFDDHVDHFIARGATRSDDLETFRSSVLFVSFPDWPAVREFIGNEPNNLNGVYKHVNVCRWGNPLGKLQRDFSRRDGDIYWYIRGVSKPGMNDRRNELVDSHVAYFNPYDDGNFIVRGGMQDDEGETWRGSANLIKLPSRAAVEDFLAEEPFYVNGLYESVLVERYTFGGRPGQRT